MSASFLRLSTHADEICDTNDDESGHKCMAEHMCVLDGENGVGEGEVMGRLGRLGRRMDDEKGAGKREETPVKEAAM